MKYRRVTRGGGGWGGGRPPLPFFKIQRKALILEKNTLTRFIYVSRKNYPKFFPAGPFFLVLQLNAYRSALILRNFPCPEKFLVTRLEYELFSGILWFLFSKTSSIPHVLVNLIKTFLINTLLIEHHLTASEITCAKVCKLWLTCCVYFSAYFREYR